MPVPGRTSRFADFISPGLKERVECFQHGTFSRTNAHGPFFGGGAAKATPSRHTSDIPQACFSCFLSAARRRREGWVSETGSDAGNVSTSASSSISSTSSGTEWRFGTNVFVISSALCFGVVFMASLLHVMRSRKHLIRDNASLKQMSRAAVRRSQLRPAVRGFRCAQCVGSAGASCCLPSMKSPACNVPARSAFRLIFP
jgi:hypothetical protein